MITQTVHIEHDLDYRTLYQRPDDADHFFDTPLYVNASTPELTRSYDLALDRPIHPPPAWCASRRWCMADKMSRPIRTSRRCCVSTAMSWEPFSGMARSIT